MKSPEAMPQVVEVNDLSSILNHINSLDESAEDFAEKKQELLRQAADLNTNEQVEVIKENPEDGQIEESEIDNETLEALTKSVENSALSSEVKEDLISDLNEILNKQ